MFLLKYLIILKEPIKIKISNIIMKNITKKSKDFETYLMNILKNLAFICIVSHHFNEYFYRFQLMITKGKFSRCIHY